jgi:FkbM family methyltransferase
LTKVKKSLQNAALLAYRFLNASGALRLPLMQRTFEMAYHLYKEKLEATEVEQLRPFVRPGTTVIDVGANIGFFVLRFAAWVSPPGKVIAIEPEQGNLDRLERALRRHDRAGIVDVLKGVAADSDGTLNIVINPHHPADHRLGAQGVPVAAFTLDRIMSDRDWPSVSLVKIDVQGAEMRVLKGAAELLRRYRPVLYIEIDDAALSESGTSAKALVDHLSGLGYEMFELAESGPVHIDPDSASKKRAAPGYADYLFKPSPQIGVIA